MEKKNYKEYFTEFFGHYRKLVNESHPIIRKTAERTYRDYLKPCQIEIMDFGVNNAIVLVVDSNKSKPDMEIIVHDKPDDPERFIDGLIERHPKLSKKRIKEMLFDLPPHSEIKFVLFSPYHSLYSMRNPLYFTPEEFAQQEYDSLKLKIDNSVSANERKAIQSASNQLKKDIKLIPDSAIKARLEDRVNAIEASLAKIKEISDLSQRITQMEGDITGMRRLVGESEEFKDWKLLVSSVDELKKEHVAREIFESRIAELNTKIESFSDMRKVYDDILSKQTEFMKQQSEVMKQQSSFITWIKYATVLLPIAIVIVPIIDAVVRYFIGA